MTTASPLSHPVSRPAMGAPARAMAIGVVLGLIVGAGIGYLVGASMKTSATWTDASTVWVRLPEQTAIGAPPQTFSIPASSYDFGGVAQPLSPTVTDASSIIEVDLAVQGGRVGVSLARPNGGELVSREAVVTPQQGKTSVYLRTIPGAGPVSLLLRAADNTGAAVSASVSKVRSAPEAGLGKSQMDKVTRAGLY